MSEASVSQKIKSKLAEPKATKATGLPPASDPIAEIKARLDRANNAFKSGVKTTAKDAGALLNDLDKVPAADKAKYADFEEHLNRVLPGGSEKVTPVRWTSKGLSTREVPERLPGETDAQFVKRVSAEAKKATTSALTPSELQAKAVEVTPTKMGELSQLQSVKQSLEAQQKANETLQESNLRPSKKVVNKEVAGIRRLKKEGGISDALQLKRDQVADKLRRRNLMSTQADSALISSELLPEEYRPFLQRNETGNDIAERFARMQNTLDAQRVYDKTKADIAKNTSVNELSTANARKARQERVDTAAEALKTQEGRNQLKAKGISKDVPLDVATRVIKGREDVARTKTAEGRRQIADEQEAIKRGVNAKSSVLDERGNVVPRQPATPDQKARRTRVSKDLNLPEKTGIASAASKEARAYMASKQPETPATPAAETQMPSKKKATDISMEEANARLERAARGETPATLHSKVEGITEGAIHSDPDMHAEVSRLASEAKAANPDITGPQMGQHLIDNVSPETRAKFFSKAGPLLEKYGIKLGKAAGAIGAYESAANIGNVAFDPSKSKKDVARAAAHEAVEATPAAVGAGLGAGAGSLVAPGPGTVVGGLAGGIAGAVGGDPAVRWLKEKMGMDQEGPQATAAHTIPTVGDALSKVSDQFSGDNWDKSPQQQRQQFKDEVAAMPEDEETLRLERMGRGEMPISELTGRTPPAQTPAAQTPPGQSQAGAAPAGAGKGITGSPALRTPATATGGGASAPAGATPAATQTLAPETKTTQDQYAGDTSEGTPEGAVAELMKLRGPGYQYSPEVMGELKDSIDEERARTALSMFANIGAGLANRDRYAGAHDAALLANQAFTSGGEREDQAKQQFLQGIIHNEQEPFERRKAAYEMYTKMQMAAAQNEALYGRALLGANTKMYGYDRQAESRAASQRDQYAAVAAGLLKNKLTTLSKEISSGMFDDATLRAKQAEYDAVQQQMNSMLSGMSGFSPALTGLADDQGLGQNPTKVRTL